MINLISINPREVLRHISQAEYVAHCGLLRSPKNASHIDQARVIGARWAADNDCFVGYRPASIKRFLANANPAGCLFFNVPDGIIRDAQGIRGDALLTLERWHEWHPLVEVAGFPPAFTLQNGMHEHAMPWTEMAALFIGSSDSYRRGSHASYVRDMIKEAKRRGKWVHVGRVNSMRSIRYWRDAGADSFDGSGYTLKPIRVSVHLPYHAGACQLSLWSSLL